MNHGSIGSDNGLSPVRQQAITWTNAALLSIGPLGTKFGEISIKIQNFSFTKMHLKISSAKQRPFCPGRHELNGNMPGKVVVSEELRVVMIYLHQILSHGFSQWFNQHGISTPNIVTQLLPIIQSAWYIYTKYCQPASPNDSISNKATLMSYIISGPISDLLWCVVYIYIIQT